ncbi:MAG: recombination regulator RecX [Zoogloeaceae bacterium]|jgi:regulatory protein|nr:recombination regulator RecX [Zoogloeaceae bacterium]
MSETLRAHALRYLSRREYSRNELRQKLVLLAADGSPSPEELETLLDSLSAQHLLSDARYAETRIGARSRRYGNLRLAQELAQAGVAAETIAAALPGPEEEVRHCRAVRERKFGALLAGPGEIARQRNFLRYRGFSAEAIRQTLRDPEEDAA